MGKLRVPEVCAADDRLNHVLRMATLLGALFVAGAEGSGHRSWWIVAESAKMGDRTNNNMQNVRFLRMYINYYKLI
jgi:hypothetical protein